MTTVTLSTPLQRLCGNRTKMVGDGETVLDVLIDTTRHYPDLRYKVLKSETEIHPQILIYINGNILSGARESLKVHADTVLNLLLIVGGG